MSQLFLSRSPYRNSLRISGFARSALSRNSRQFAVRSSARLKVEIGPVAVIISLRLLAGLLSVLQLIQFNKIATKGYEMKRIEADRKQLLSEYELRNMELAQMQSFSHLTSTAKVVGMNQAPEVQFVTGNTAIASK